MNIQPHRILRHRCSLLRATINNTPSRIGPPNSRVTLIVCTALLLSGCAPLTTREAGTLTGAGYGAAIGALAGGGSGAATGAGIGALTGLLLGDLAQSTRRYPTYPPPTYYYGPLQPQYVPPPYYYPYLYPRHHPHHHSPYPYWPW